LRRFFMVFTSGGTTSWLFLAPKAKHTGEHYHALKIFIWRCEMEIVDKMQPATACKISRRDAEVILQGHSRPMAESKPSQPKVPEVVPTSFSVILCASASLREKACIQPKVRWSLVGENRL
jgi:hypothetical protein